MDNEDIKKDTEKITKKTLKFLKVLRMNMFFPAVQKKMMT